MHPYSVKLISGDLLRGKSPVVGTEIVFSGASGRLRGTILEKARKDKVWAASGMTTALLRRDTEQDEWQCLGVGNPTGGGQFFFNRDMDFTAESPALIRPTKKKHRKLKILK